MVDIKYTEDHCYVMIESGGLAVVGLTDYILETIRGGIGGIELSATGIYCEKGDVVGTLVATEKEIQINTPVSGEIAEVNEAILEDPDNIKMLPPEDRWLFKVYVSPDEDLGGLFGEEEYEEYIAGL